MRLGRLGAIGVAALLALPLLAWPLPGAAHAILVAGTPAAGATVAARKLHVQLRFNSRIDAARSRLTLSRGDQSGAGSVLAAHGAGAEDTLDAETTVAPGAYTLRWQVLAVDGHITRGDIPFTMAAP